jgi:hypothetical protein
MFWFCETCNDWGVADTEVDLVVDRQRHMGAHVERALEMTEPQEESVAEVEDTVLRAKYLAWGSTALLGLLSARWHALAGVVPFAALLVWVVTQSGNEGE